MLIIWRKVNIFTNIKVQTINIFSEKKLFLETTQALVFNIYAQLSC